MHIVIRFHYELNINQNYWVDITGKSKICIIQISYRNQEGIYKCNILLVLNYTLLLSQLFQFLKDNTITFTRICLGSNLVKIGRDFYSIEIIKNIKHC